MTPEEKRWFERLRRVVRDMPKSVELQVHNNFIQMNETGKREEAFLARGHADIVDSLAGFQTDRVYPCGESI